MVWLMPERTGVGEPGVIGATCRIVKVWPVSRLRLARRMAPRDSIGVGFEGRVSATALEPEQAAVATAEGKLGVACQIEGHDGALCSRG